MIMNITLVAFLCIGILTGIYGIPTGYPLFAVLFPVLSALQCIISVVKINAKKGVLLLILLGLFSLLVETIALKTGFPYGYFMYSQLFSITIMGTPIIVPFAWIPLCIGSFMLSQKTTKNSIKQYFLFLLFLVGADLVIDPGAVSVHLWEYTYPGIYYAIPFSNFMGWILSGTIGYLISKTLVPTGIQNSGIENNYLLILFYWTGVCIANLLLLPGVIGVVLSLYIFTLIKKTNLQQ